MAVDPYVNRRSRWTHAFINRAATQTTHRGVQRSRYHHSRDFIQFFFVAYLLSPKFCHRSVGYLEEEAIKTYTSMISSMDHGKLSEWKREHAPVIARIIGNYPIPPLCTTSSRSLGLMKLIIVTSMTLWQTFEVENSIRIPQHSTVPSMLIPLLRLLRSALS